VEHSKPNGVSSLEEFKKSALEDRIKRSEVVTLPSGLKARLVKPTAWETFMQSGTLPQSVAASFSPSSDSKGMSFDDAVSIARRTVELVRFVFVDPSVPEQCRPGIDIPFSDIEFALQWARGEVTDSGQNLGTFPDKRESAPRIPNA
jgi:hypothetical protein